MNGLLRLAKCHQNTPSRIARSTYRIGYASLADPCEVVFWWALTHPRDGHS